MLTPHPLIDAQIEAYRERNIEKFVSFYSPDVKVYRAPDAAPYISSRDELRSAYSEFFQLSPNLIATVTERVIDGPYVFDTEELTGMRGNLALHRAKVRYTVDGLFIVEMVITRLE